MEERRRRDRRPGQRGKRRKARCFRCEKDMVGAADVATDRVKRGKKRECREQQGTLA